MVQEQIQSIRQKAEALLGESLGEGGNLLIEMAADRAMALCNRKDVPKEMEQAVAALVVPLATAGEIKSLTRGDTSITYGTKVVPESLLAPWRKLGTLEERADE